MPHSVEGMGQKGKSILSERTLVQGVIVRNGRFMNSGILK